MSHYQPPLWEKELSDTQMNRLFDHSLITIEGVGGNRQLYDGEHQATVGCPVVSVGRILRPSIAGDIDLAEYVPADVHIQSFRDAGVILVSLAFRDGDAPFIGRPYRGLRDLNHMTSSYGDEESVDSGFTKFTSVITYSDRTGRITYEKIGGKKGVLSAVTPDDVFSLASVGLFAYSRHTRFSESNRGRPTENYNNPALYA